MARAWASTPHRVYVIVGFVLGLLNLVVMQTFLEPRSLLRLSFLTLAMVLLTLMPVRPLPVAFGYQALWTALLLTPGPYGSDMIVTNLVFFFFAGRFFPLWVAVAFGAYAGLLMATEPWQIMMQIAFLNASTIIPGAILRRVERSWQQDVSAAAENLAAVRAEVAREMHDLVAYSMSQTALRAQLAAANTSFSPEARQEFRALESTAADALHELRLILRALRRNDGAEDPDGTDDPDAPRGLGTVVLDLDGAVRAVAEDLSGAGFPVTYQHSGTGDYGRMQATTLSRVAREMGSNIVRHGDPASEVTVILTQGAAQLRLVMTNKVSDRTDRNLPSSGTGLLGMKERLSAVGGTLTVMEDNGTWMASASVPTRPSKTDISEEPA